MEFHFQKVNNSNLSKSKRSKSEQRQANLFSLGGPEIKSLFLKQNKRNFLLKMKYYGGVNNKYSRVLKEIDNSETLFLNLSKFNINNSTSSKLNSNTTNTYLERLRENKIIDKEKNKEKEIKYLSNHDLPKNEIESESNMRITNNQSKSHIHNKTFNFDNEFRKLPFQFENTTTGKFFTPHSQQQYNVLKRLNEEFFVTDLKPAYKNDEKLLANKELQVSGSLKKIQWKKREEHASILQKYKRLYEFDDEELYNIVSFTAFKVNNLEPEKELYYIDKKRYLQLKKKAKIEFLAKLAATIDFNPTYKKYYHKVITKSKQMSKENNKLANTEKSQDIQHNNKPKINFQNDLSRNFSKKSSDILLKDSQISIVDKNSLNNSIKEKDDETIDKEDHVIKSQAKNKINKSKSISSINYDKNIIRKKINGSDSKIINNHDNSKVVQNSYSNTLQKILNSDATAKTQEIPFFNKNKDASLIGFAKKIKYHGQLLSPLKLRQHNKKSLNELKSSEKSSSKKKKKQKSSLNNTLIPQIVDIRVKKRKSSSTKSNRKLNLDKDNKTSNKNILDLSLNLNKVQRPKLPVSSKMFMSNKLEKLRYLKICSDGEKYSMKYEIDKFMEKNKISKELASKFLGEDFFKIFN